MQIDLTTRIGNLTLKNPVLGASGTFGYGVEFADLIDLNAIGGFVTKGLSLRPRDGNKPPRIHETYAGMLNSIGLNNIGVEAFLRDKLPQLRKYDTKVIANIYGENPEDFVQVAKELNGADGLHGMEINVSCPNVKGGLDLGTNAVEVRKLVENIRKETDMPLWAKLTPNVTDLPELAKAAIDGGADALSLINSLKGMALDLGTRKPCISSVVGGVTGPAIKPIALAKVWEVSQKYPIIGIGGIVTGMDVLEFLVVGASAVQVGTQNFVRTDAMITILEGMTKYMQEHEIPSVSSMIKTLKPL
jgi:dihydroorotate dehydrogenase (NAD+) catalytic subunit